MKSEHRRIDWSGIIIETIFLIFAIILIIQLILKIIGGSPTESQLIYLIFSFGLTYILNTNKEFNYKFGKIDQHLIDIDRRLMNMEQTLKEKKSN